MQYFILTIIIFLISQSLKFIFRFFKNTKDSKKISWVFLWATGAPSTHSAILVGNLVLFYKDVGLNSTFSLFTVISVILMYNLVADRQREIIRESFLVNGDHVSKEMVTSGKVLDISGHSFFDIITGVLLGLLIGFIY